ncbi:hypothetical protein U1Q18_040327 [Sarracenia purpurea var. burkii]
MIALSLVRDVLACGLLTLLGCSGDGLFGGFPCYGCVKFCFFFDFIRACLVMGSVPVVLMKMMVKKLHISWVAFRVSVLAGSCRLKVEDEVAVTRSGRVGRFSYGEEQHE